MRGALLNSLTLCLIIVGIVGIDGIGRGQDRWWIAIELGAGVLLGVVFVRRELAARHPLLPVDLLRIPAFPARGRRSPRRPWPTSRCRSTSTT